MAERCWQKLKKRKKRDKKWNRKLYVVTKSFVSIITDIFFISENLVDGAGMPFGFASTGENTVTVQPGGNLIHAETFQVFSIYAFYDFCLFLVNNKVAVRILRIARKRLWLICTLSSRSILIRLAISG